MTVRKSKQIYLGHLAILRAGLLFLQLYFTGVGKKCIFGGGGLRGKKGIFHPSFHLLGPNLNAPPAHQINQKRTRWAAGTLYFVVGWKGYFCCFQRQTL